MKIALFVICAVLLLGCGEKQKQVKPAWFGKPSTSQYIIVGYGEGADTQSARNEALAQISNTLKAQVKSEFLEQTTLDRNSYKQSAIRNLSVYSETKLSGVETIYETSIGERFFAALSYDIRPFEERLTEKIGKPKCAQKSGFLNASFTGQRLKEILGCDIALKVYIQNGVWLVGTNNVVLAWNEESLERLYPERIDPRITISASKERLKEGESFYLYLMTESDGFVSLFNLYDSGQTALMAGNLALKAFKRVTIPQSIDPTLDLVASTNGKEFAKDFYIAIYSQKPLALSRFEQTGAYALQAGRGDSLEELIALLEGGAWSAISISVSRF